MRTTQKFLLAGGMALVLGIGLAGVQIAAAGTPSSNAAVTVATTGETATDDTRTADLTYSRDEERMARDLYVLFDKTYDAPIFHMIAAGEQKHFDAVGTLMAENAIADPAVGPPAGTYANPDVQRLYNQWKAQGLTSLQDAYSVGVALEQTDIADLEKMLARQTDTDVQRVFGHLLTASRHHLAAFTDAANGGPDAVCDGSGSGSGMRDGHSMGDGAGMGRMGRGDS